MRILFTSTPGLGHLHPLLPFIRAARARGHEVRLATTVEEQPAAAQFGVPLVPIGAPPPEVAGPFWAGLSQQADQDSYVIGRWFAGHRTRAALPAVHAEVTQWRPDLVVSEAAELAGHLSAEAAGVPHVTVGVTTLSTPGFTSRELVDETNAARRLLGLPETAQVIWRRPTTRYVTAVPRVLWGSPDEVPDGTLLVRHEDPEGPVTHPAPRPRPAADRPTVYATLGSAAPRVPFGAPAYPLVLAGLGQLDADVLFTVGALDLDSLGDVPPNVTIERYVPQAEAMARDLVISHGGCGTTIAALRRGLPQVVVPLFADQMHNGERIAAAGIGETVNPCRAPQDLAPAVERVLGTSSYAAAARAVAAELERLPSADDVLAQLVPVAVY